MDKSLGDIIHIDLVVIGTQFFIQFHLSKKLLKSCIQITLCFKMAQYLFSFISDFIIMY